MVGPPTLDSRDISCLVCLLGDHCAHAGVQRQAAFLLAMVNGNPQAQFDLAYDGPALAEGSMNVRDLAPAMMAVGGFFEAANRIANGERTSVSVNVRATSASSFHILFEVIQNFQASGILEAEIGEILTTANTLKALLIGGGVGGVHGIIGLLKWLRGRKPKVKKINENLYTLTLDSETYEVPIALLRMYQDVTVRRNIQDMMKPVKESGIDRVMLSEAGQIIQEITKDDVDAFDVPEYEDLILDEVRQQAFSIISLAFKEKNKWRLTDGQNTIPVSMKDDVFQRKVDNNAIAFAKGDVLVCELRTIQWQVEDGVKSEYEVIRVVSHRPARQMSLFDEHV